MRGQASLNACALSLLRMGRIDPREQFDAQSADWPFDRARLRAAYPHTAQPLDHALEAECCFTWARLEDIFDCGDRSLIEVREDGVEGRFRPLSDLPAKLGPLVASLSETKRWIMLRDLARWPEFERVVAEILAGIAPVAAPHTGELLKPVAFLFASSPGLLTPLHFDPEYNILFQIAGHKRFTVLPQACGLPSAADNERFHRTGDNLLPWTPQLAEHALHFDMGPGDALYVPFKAAHTVTVGDSPSISLSVTWRSRDSLLQDDAWAMNGLLARCGVRAPKPGGRPWVRAGTLRALRRARLA
ncbi:cupin-like domain-containing protein [Erythrobacter sp. AP23]|uniref:cupin-like domain-containing protein n=1 Tax=Erythrobacter sp. AP23 TaxID=499656 RepID=UPI0009F845F4|nr:cupin-like domain-containing protein [Erythrobacter sp. AP23]